MTNLIRDFLHGWRILARNPGFAAMAVITLALGIGASAAIFSVVYAVLLRPLPYGEPHRVVALWQNNVKRGVARDRVSAANFIDWRDRSQVFEQVAAIDPWGFDYSGGDEPETFRASRVTEGFFQILGATPLYGRTLLPEDHQPGRHRVAVLSHGLWKRRFGSDPALVGKRLLFDREPFTVIGVMPPEFDLPAGREVWGPKVLTDSDRRNRLSNYWEVVARLKPGRTFEQAQADMSAVAARMAADYPPSNQGSGVTVVPLEDQLVGEVRPALLVLLGASGFVLLIACANVANLLLARGAGRQAELAIRAALGASRWRLVRQMLGESLALAVSGGAAGLWLSSRALDAIVQLAPGNLPRLDAARIDARVLAFTLAVSALTALAFGLAPALRASLARIGTAATPRVSRSISGWLVIGEVALALVLLTGAGLLARSFVNLLRVDPGFAAQNVLSLQVFAWDLYATPELRAEFVRQALERIQAVPGVKVAGLSSRAPFSPSVELQSSFTIVGQPEPPPGDRPSALLSVGDPGYFRAMGIPLVRGRLFTDFDDPKSAPVVLINQAFARRHFPGQDPIGRKISVGLARLGPREIVGVVGDVRQKALDSEPRPEIYVAHRQHAIGHLTFVVRTTSDPAGMLPAVKAEIYGLNKMQPIYAASTVEQSISDSLAYRRFNLLLLGVFAGVALTLAAVGVYGVVSYAVSRRRREIGIRMALGATRSEILRAVVGRAAALALAGVALGIAGSLALTRLLGNLLYGVTPTDAATMAGVSALLLAVTLAASHSPARRATRLDPMLALRYE